MNAARKFLSRIADLVRRFCDLTKAMAHGTILGVLETVTTERGRRVLALITFALMAVAAGLGFFLYPPLEMVEPGMVAVRLNRLTGTVERLSSGLNVELPGIHEVHLYRADDNVYRPGSGESSGGAAPYKTEEGLSIGVQVMVRYALDPDRSSIVLRAQSEDSARLLIEPTIDGVLHRTLAKHTVREIFSEHRSAIEQTVTDDLKTILAPDGVLIRSVFLGNVDLPSQYRNNLESLLAEELASQKMRYTLTLKEQQVKESELVGLADKVRREKAAEATAQESLIEARAKEEAMKHVLPLRQKEIEQKRLEAEASRVSRLKIAETEAEARKIEGQGESDYRRKLAESEAYRIEITGKASSDQLAREGSVITKNPLLIQKTLAEKLSDKIQVIIAPPEAGGFFAGGLLGNAVKASASSTKESPSEE